MKIGKAKPRKTNRPKSKPISLRFYEDDYLILVNAWKNETREEISFSQWFLESINIDNFITNLKSK